METIMIKSSQVNRKYYVIDAAGKPLGRLGVIIARLLMGKHKVDYTPHIDNGDYVIVKNASKAIMTGKKMDYKVFFWHSGYPGGLKHIHFKEAIEKNPRFVFERVVRGMLPKNRLRKHRLRRLIVFKDENAKIPSGAIEYKV
ncbi:MAG: 50S ribosomal protein L13 [Brevinematales bacterium]|nr:50S ribosomal protein L13 [Brevinematales bacterium]